MLTEIDSAPPAPHSLPRTSAVQRYARSARKATRDNRFARGFVLFAGLVTFTVLCSVALQRFPVPGVTNLVTATGPAPAALSVLAPLAFHSIDDGIAGTGDHFSYSGAWQHLAGVRDGRSGGTSSRTYRVGAKAFFTFTGSRMKVFGVKGPNGGYAKLRIDGDTFGLLSFYAPRKQAGVLIYESPPLRTGPHGVEMIVAQAPAGQTKRRFVNLDGAAYDAR